jgi:hypothetical protein
MSLLKSIIRGVKPQPHFVLLYGVDGVGKSTFGADAPKPVFLGPEDGLGMLDVPRFPTPRTWAELKAAVNELLQEDHEYETLVIDSIDWCEPLLWAFLCKEENVKSIEQVGGGFGKGYVQAREQWLELIRLLQRLRKKMNVIGIAHALVKTTEDPYVGERYDRYIVKMNDQSASLWREAVDCVFFANFATSFSKKKGAMKARAEGDGRRVMFTERRPAFDAKNRFGLPFEMDLSWSEFAAAAAAALPSSHEDTDDKMMALFKGVEAEATAFLLSLKWLEEGQPLSDLRKVNRNKILSRPEGFLAAVKKHAEEATEPTTEDTTNNAE